MIDSSSDASTDKRGQEYVSMDDLLQSHSTDDSNNSSNSNSPPGTFTNRSSSSSFQLATDYDKDKTEDKHERQTLLTKHSSTQSTTHHSAYVRVAPNQSPAVNSNNNNNKQPSRRSSVIQSFFKGSSWVMGGSSKNISFDKLSQLNKTDDAISALQQAIQSKNNAFMRGAADLITRLCEQDKTKTVSTELGSLGACGLVDQMLSLRTDITADSHLICESCLRAICSLIVAPAAASSSAEWITVSDDDDTGGVVTSGSYSSVECIAGVVSNRKSFSSHGPIYRIIKVGTVGTIGYHHPSIHPFV